VSDDGIPNQTTTEVTTTMLVESGKTVFIGGLIKRTAAETREGIPVLGDIPGVGLLFSNKGIASVNTELVVLITPHILNPEGVMDAGNSRRVNAAASELEVQPKKINRTMAKVNRFEDALGLGGGQEKSPGSGSVPSGTVESETEQVWFYE
jgi:type II secretory pathway component GspD/PulD (secretin)